MMGLLVVVVVVLFCFVCSVLGSKLSFVVSFVKRRSSHMAVDMLGTCALGAGNLALPDWNTEFDAGKTLGATG